jgi:hypothetical protein
MCAGEATERRREAVAGPMPRRGAVRAFREVSVAEMGSSEESEVSEGSEGSDANAVAVADWIARPGLDFNMPMRVGRYIPCFLGFVSIILFFLYSIAR